MKVLVATLPLLAVFKFDDWFDTHFHNMVSVAPMLIIYGIAFIYLEKRNKARAIEPSVTELDKLPYTTAFYIGLFQVLAFYQELAVLEPTIVGGLLNGTSRSVVTEFTFYLGIPVMFGASALKIFKFLKAGTALELWAIVLALGCDSSFCGQHGGYSFLDQLCEKHDFTLFGKYRIVLGSVLLLYSFVRLFV